ncbi:MAG: DUF1836 domain-containing protein [Clostridia bacterium]|nr:DUF1836 domain-containing protein [Clostridia bacterium]
MSEQTENILKNWCELVTKQSAIDWEHLPSLGLYMDQVLTLTEEELAVASIDGVHPITSSMINNYVKDGVLPRPDKKKYSREHLAILYMVCMMKSQLPLPQIAQLMQELKEENSIEMIYGAFIKRQTEELQEVADLAAEADGDRQQLARLAMEMALEANARHLAAVQILKSIEQADAAEKTAEKQAAKEEKKEAKSAKKAAKKAVSESEESA